ncbi:AMP-binding enzyme [Nocardia sp. CA-135953]|uniref:AMP-binding enzyme n=1 Tax=Nocardia sp. CA-135953 TaxID=3239978 RepID=UPI003D969CBD
MTADLNARVRELLEAYDGPDVSAADLLCDRHPADRIAFTIVDPDLTSTDLTYGELRERSQRFAVALADLGVEPGDRIATLMSKSADLVVALLGIWRRVAVHVPLFTAFAPPAIDTRRSPLLWFLGYLHAPERTAQRYTADGRWYLTGDAGSQDADGFFHFSARDDDVIIMAGYRIGPFEVESVLVLDERVVEAAVVGMTDELRGEVLEAFVVLRNGFEGNAELEAELQTLVKRKFAAHAYPRKVHFVDALPKTPSGKVQRFILRQQGVR